MLPLETNGLSVMFPPLNLNSWIWQPATFFSFFLLLHSNFFRCYVFFPLPSFFFCITPYSFCSSPIPPPHYLQFFNWPNLSVCLFLNNKSNLLSLLDSS